MRSTGIGALLLALLATSCGPSSSGLAESTRAIEPYREQFASFDAWARRAQATAKVTPNRAALDEATFAPLRNDGDVLAAWVELGHKQRITLAMPERTAVPGVSGWVSLRDDELGVLKVVSAARCPVDVPGWWRQGRGEGPCVLASRTQPTDLDGELTVTVAYVPRQPPAHARANR